MDVQLKDECENLRVKTLLRTFLSHLILTPNFGSVMMALGPMYEINNSNCTFAMIEISWWSFRTRSGRLPNAPKNIKWFRLHLGYLPVASSAYWESPTDIRNVIESLFNSKEIEKLSLSSLTNVRGHSLLKLLTMKQI